MHDLELEAYAKQKLSAYRREKEAPQQKPKRSWRSRTAHFLRELADGLEVAPSLP